MATRDVLELIAAAVGGVWIAAIVVALQTAGRKQPEVAPAEEPAPVGLPPGAEPLSAPEMSNEVLSLSRLPIWRFDSALRFVGANDAYGHVLGFPDGASAVEAERLLAPESRALAAEAQRAGTAIVGEERVVIDGARRLLEIVAIPLRHEEVIVFALDETRRHAAATAAAGRARTFADVIDRTSVGIAIFDVLGVLKLGNRGFRRLFRLDRAFTERSPNLESVLDAMRLSQRAPELGDFPRWRTEHVRWLAGGETRRERWTLPGGDVIQVRGEPLDDGYALFFEDVTEQARLAAGRAELASVYRATVEALSEGVAVFGPDGVLKLHNRRFAEIVLMPEGAADGTWSADEMIDHIAGLIEPAAARELRDLILKATSQRQAHHGSITSQLGYSVEVNVRPLPDGNALFALIATRPQAAHADA